MVINITVAICTVSLANMSSIAMVVNSNYIDRQLNFRDSRDDLPEAVNFGTNPDLV